MSDDALTIETLRDAADALRRPPVPARIIVPPWFIEGQTLNVGGATVRVTSVDATSITVVDERAWRAERSSEQRAAWQSRILARLATPTEDDRAEAAEVAAWVRTGDPLPLP